MSAPKPAWEADIQIDLAKARSILFSQFPDLGPDLDLVAFGEGFDNAAFLANGETVFRFPRREFAVQFIRTETRVLPRLGPHLPFPIPAPTYFGRPDPLFPYPFAGYHLIPGRSASLCDWDTDRLRRLAPQVGEFLRALHTIPVTDEDRSTGPLDEIRRSQVDYRLAQIQGFRDRYPELVGRAEQLASGLESSTELRWVHGDLHPRHLLIGGAGELTGVIDWGDVHLGDPALDLSIAYTLFDAESRGPLFDAYGPISPEMHRRARFRAIFYAVILADYSAKTGDAEMARVAQWAAQNA